jgi:peptidoglycan/LPS O-acetylase OafA/YrhL
VFFYRGGGPDLQSGSVLSYCICLRPHVCPIPAYDLRRKYLSCLENPVLRRIGIISYSIYLIHEDIGVLLINKYGGALGRFSVLSPFIVMILMTVFAETSYRFYEQRASGV